MSARRWAVALLGAVAAGLIAAPGAAAGTFEVPYDWTDNRYGFAGWELRNVPAGETFYRGTMTPGTGLRIASTATPGLTYRTGESRWTWVPPAGARIRRAQISGVSGKAVQRQFARVWLVIDGEADDQRTELKELGYDRTGGGPASAEWNDRSWTMLAPGSKVGSGFFLWQFTIPCESAGEPAPCTGVSPSAGAEVSMRRAVFTIEDPTKPTAEVAGLPDGTTWTRDRQLRLSVAATDMQSGVARVDAVVRGSGSTRRSPLGAWTPDRYNAAPRAAGTPPLDTARTVVRTIAISGTGTTRVAVETINGAGMKAVQEGRVRVDRERPDVRWPGSVRPAETVRVADSPSGVKEATLTVDGRERDRCEDAASCQLRVPSNVPDRARVSVRVVDRAGNERTGERTARVRGVSGDKRRPKIAWPRSLRSGSKATVTDESSGVAEASLSVVDAPAPADRCGDGGRRCSVGVPPDAAGKQVRVTAVDRAGNRASSTRRVADHRCRPPASCDAPSAFLAYPQEGANLWEGPIRFRWSRPSGGGGVSASWYRLELDGDEVYAGQDLQHDEYGIAIGPHRWRVRAYASERSRKVLLTDERRFTMSEFGTPGGSPTDTEGEGDPDGIFAGQPQNSDGTDTPETPFSEQARTRAAGTSAGYPQYVLDMARRYMPDLRLESSEMWSPLNMDNLLTERANQHCRDIVVEVPTSSGTRKKTSSDCGEVNRLGDGFPNPTYKGGKAHVRFGIDWQDVKNEEKFNWGADLAGDGKRRRRSCKNGLSPLESNNRNFECRGEQTMYWAAAKSPGDFGRGWKGLWIIEYWFFYRYNYVGGTGDHEGDWEGVKVFAERRNGKKQSRDVIYHQHEALVHYYGNQESCGDVEGRQPETNRGTKRGPNVYVSNGRHASYPCPGTGQDVPDISSSERSARSVGEHYRGGGRWTAACDRQRVGSVCLKEFPTAPRSSLTQSPVPEGKWSGFDQKWGDSGASPMGPGWGATNGPPFRTPFALWDSLLDKTESGDNKTEPRSVGGMKATPRADSPGLSSCADWFGAGVTIAACGPGPNAPDTFVEVDRPGETASRMPTSEVTNGPGWIFQRVAAAPKDGDAIVVRLPSGPSRLVMRLAGRRGEPYVASIDATALRGEQRLRIVADTDGIPRVLDAAGVPVGSITAGMTLERAPAVDLSVKGSVARLQVANLPAIRRFETSATQDGATASTRVRGWRRVSGGGEDGYTTYQARVPARSTALHGQVFVDGQDRPVTIEAEANVPIFRPAPPARRAGTGSASADGTGRPTT